MKNLELQIKGPAAWVWLNRPQKLNVIDPTTLQGIRQAIDAADRNESIRVIVLAGRGRVFCAGFDVSSMLELTPHAVAHDLDDVGAVFDAIETCPKPVIAAIDGPAMGGGLLLALLSDFRLASPRASFGAPEVKIGIFPSLDLIPRLERLVGLGAAKSLVLTGEPIDAVEAHRLGLVSRISPPEMLYAEAEKLVERLAALPPLALRLCKAALYAERFPNYSAWEKEQFIACWASPEREAAMRAFLKSR